MKSLKSIELVEELCVLVEQRETGKMLDQLLKKGFSLILIDLKRKLNEQKQFYKQLKAVSKYLRE